MKDIYQVLAELGISYKKYEHPPVFTVEDADLHRGEMQGGTTKNLFLRNKKGKRHYLLVLESNRQVEIKQIQGLLGESSLSFASPERLQKYLGLTPGAVSPFGIINDTEHAVTVVVDAGLLRHETLHYHPNNNTATLAISTEDFRRFLAASGNEVRYEELPP
ncbi:MAG: prolyl-tRNA synthetase associated domain-containing protein [SAR324 cluster bacterium]|nr:prolyl-tRNA synthetase associated domain-containing protein [SAR324 cluster bacterium]MCZ6534118.1 prolyl-tRNA synthetase associated domain-containing protein [SAR324 cluster bacterium]MCZ6626716.1 prolyl-tRNA synthetase associated domain-containing protein [SAR324 cluster bacterium]MCZ6647508.1 prolyl-tRNA synthetase associated domain-containing protein [SAR324 cluster bacterium]MCZ6728575.1 prolyl-tRNA synthetase associated domain-containing protein [SAR324 cluster bacterium]